MPIVQAQKDFKSKNKYSFNWQELYAKALKLNS